MTMKREHTDREYEAELRHLREQLLLMGAQVEEAITASIKALLQRDSALARRTIEADQQVNRLEVEIDEVCMRILAKRQPVASDLRFITMAMKMVTDLERIGDMAVNTCERVIDLNAEPQLKPYVDLPKMTELVQGMVRDALDAFVNRDATRARNVIDRDRDVNAYYQQIFRELLTYMMEDPRNIQRATRVQSIAKYIERMGDHATNLAELVIFMVKGKDIRHMGRIQDPEQLALPHGVTPQVSNLYSPEPKSDVLPITPEVNLYKLLVVQVIVAVPAGLEPANSYEHHIQSVACLANSIIGQ